MKQYLRVSMLLLWANATWSAEQSCKITDFGIFGKEAPVVMKGESGAATGQIQLYVPSAIVKHTDNVEAKIGTRFGVKHQFIAIPSEKELFAIVSHPAIISPSGEKKDQTKVTINSRSSESSYSFDRENELLAGKWSFRFDLNGKTLCEKTFTVSN